ncbi:MAG TPA: type II secretion system secretin GspD [Xanthobacteraceae bacterium]|nr:type II secretion system secretin GspD [Xanthobacteraceae bacterium]
MSKSGDFAGDPRPPGRGWRAALIALNLGLLAACAQLPDGRVVSTGPDIMDKVRSMDVLPRFPQQPPAAGRNDVGPSAKAQVYPGVTIPAVEGAEPRPTPTGEAYELNFENTPIASVAKVVLGDILGTGYTIDPRVMGMISLSSGRPVPKSDLLFVLENALRLSGVVLVKDVQGYRLIPLGDAVGAGNLDTAEAQAEPGYGVSVVPLRYVSAATLIKLLDSFATKPGTVRADTSRNLLLIQGSGAERRTAIETVLGFDVDWMRGQSVGVYPVRFTSPETLITELEKIMDTGDGGLSQNIVKFQPVARLNAVLVVTRKPNLLKTAENWIKRLDASDTNRNGVHVYHVKYGEARQLARVLNDIFVGGGGSFDTPANQVAPGSGLGRTAGSTDRLAASGPSASANVNFGGSFGGGLGGSGGGGGGLGGGGGRTGAAGGGLGAGGGGGLGAGSAFGRQQTQGAPATDTSGLEGRTPSAGGGGQPVLEGVRITPDVQGNTLLIYASQENYQIVARTLAQLDRPKLQVAIDATVAEVTLNDDLKYGVQFFLQGKYHGVLGNTSNIPTVGPGPSSSTSNSLFNASDLAGAALGRAFPGFNFMIGKENLPNVVLDALHSITSTKVLSNPSVVVVDNEVATLMVGSDVPITTGSATLLTGNGSVVNSIDYRSVGIILRVVPRVNANGHVRLDIEQEISQVQDNTGVGGNPTFSQRKVKSSIGVASGQTVLLAGLIQEQQTGNRGGIPLLDQIQNIGDVFSHQDKTNARTELIVFIRPQIIRDSVDASFVAEELRTKLRGTLGAVPPDVPPVPKKR